MLIGIFLTASAFLPFTWRAKQTTIYAWLNVIALKYICGINYEVSGRENIPDRACIIFSKHQSTWETFALQLVFPTLTFIVKRELLWVPFFGWGLARMKPIAINRNAGRNAIRQVVTQGKQRLKDGICIVIFPEGSRFKPGLKTDYKKGAGVLAAAADVPVIPVAHNAGEFWPKKQFIKRPGKIQLRIGPPLDTQDKSALEIVEAGRQWIESELHTINPDIHPGP